jgi:hypothetical protein
MISPKNMMCASTEATENLATGLVVLFQAWCLRSALVHGGLACAASWLTLRDLARASCFACSRLKFGLFNCSTCRVNSAAPASARSVSLAAPLTGPLPV